MTEFFTGLALIAIGGFATIAIRYPKGFSRMYWALLALTALVMVGSLIYSIGYSRGGMDLYPYLERDRREEAFAVSFSGGLPMDWILTGGVAFMFYVVLLSALPTILGISEDGDKKSDRNDKS